MTDRELLQQALEALEKSVAVGGFDKHSCINAIRARLAEPEQCKDEDDCDHMPWCRIHERCINAEPEDTDARLAEPPAVTLPPLPEGYVRYFRTIGGRYVELRVIDEDNVRNWRDKIVESLRAAGVEVAK